MIDRAGSRQLCASANGYVDQHSSRTEIPDIPTADPDDKYFKSQQVSSILDQQTSSQSEQMQEDDGHRISTVLHLVSHPSPFNG